MGRLCAFLRQGFVMISPGRFGIEREVGLIFPPKFESRFAEGIVAMLSSRMALRQISGVGRNFVGNHSLLNILLVWQSQMLFWRHIAEHGAAVPPNHRGADSTRNMVIARCDISRQGAKRI